MIETTAINQRNVLTGAIVVALLAICAVSLLVIVNRSSSETAESSTTASGPATIGEKDATTGIASVTFMDSAIERVGVETATVGEGPGGSLSVPYGALLYDSKGHSYVYTVVGPGSYLRAEVTVDHVEGDQAILSAGPAAGTEIASQGVAELYGAETGLK